MTLTSPKYSSIQVYNSSTGGKISENSPYEHNSEAAGTGEEIDDVTEESVIASFCDDKSADDLVEILLKNVSTIPVKL